MSQENTPQNPAPQQAHKEEVMHRHALLRYVVIMFAMALVLVLLSMVLQNKNSNSTISQLHQSSTSALTRANALQEANRQLEDQLKMQIQLNDELQKSLNEANGNLGTAKKETEELKALYEAFLIVLFGVENAPDRETYLNAIETVNQYKHHLSAEMALHFDAIVDAMEE